MKCPVCSAELKLSERKNIEIDYCPQCRGVWLDRGELDKLLETSSAEFKRHGDRDDDDYDSSRRHHGYKKKSLLSEIFDF